MLPLVSEQLCADLGVLLQNPEQFTLWQKQMIRQLQESNPGVNGLLLNLAQESQDPKAAIIAGFSVYQVLHWAYESQRNAQLQGVKATNKHTSTEKFMLEST
jgi:hypothetical protein